MVAPSHAHDICTLGGVGRNTHVVDSGVLAASMQISVDTGRRFNADQPRSIDPCLDQHPQQAPSPPHF